MNPLVRRLLIGRSVGLVGWYVCHNINPKNTPSSPVGAFFVFPPSLLSNENEIFFLN